MKYVGPVWFFTVVAFCMSFPHWSDASEDTEFCNEMRAVYGYYTSEVRLAKDRVSTGLLSTEEVEIERNYLNNLALVQAEVETTYKELCR